MRASADGGKFAPPWIFKPLKLPGFKGPRVGQDCSYTKSKCNHLAGRKRRCLEGWCEGSQGGGQTLLCDFRNHLKNVHFGSIKIQEHAAVEASQQPSSERLIFTTAIVALRDIHCKESFQQRDSKVSLLGRKASQTSKHSCCLCGVYLGLNKRLDARPEGAPWAISTFTKPCEGS